MIKNYFLVLIAFLCLAVSGFGQTFNQITSLAELTDGNYLIVGDGSSNDGLMLNATASSVYIDYTNISNPGATISTGFTNDNVFSITLSGGNITIYNASVGYASWGRTGATANDADFYNGTIGNNERWTPTVNGAGLWTLSNVSNTSRILQWNNSSPRFVAYTSNQVKLKLYKEAAPTAPTITATPTTISGLDYSFGNGPSAPQSFDVEGTLLVAGTTVTSSSPNFEVSLTAIGGYGNSVNVPAGTLNGTTTIYTRLVAGLAVNTYNSTVTISNATPGLGTTPTITVSGEVTPAPPANDNCSGAISFTPTSTCTYTSYTNVNATDSGITDPSCSSYGGGDVWFSVVVPASGEITVETSQNGIISDTGVSIYTGSCGSLIEEVCNDDGGTGYMSLATASGLTVGSTVYIRVWEYGGGTEGTFDICVTTPTPCMVPSNQPANLTFSNITGSSIDGSFSATTADEYLVVVSTSATLGANPVNGTTYSTGDTIGSGTVVQSSNATTFSATGLSQTTQYYFFVFAYNDSSCAGGPTYNTTNPLTGDETTITGPCASESFVNVTDNGSYSTKAWTGDNGIDWTATDSRSDEDLAGDEAIMLRNGSLTNDTSFSGGCGVISFDYARIFSGNSTLQVFINGIQYGGDIAVSSTNSTTFSATINVPEPIDVELRNSGNRTLISNLSWSCYSGGANPELQLVDNTATNQNCGYTIDFGTQSVASNTDLTFDIENVGSVDLDITSLNITGDYTIVSPATPFTVTSGNSQTVTIRFTPSTTGTRTGVLTINNNDIDEGSCAVNLTGEGFTPAPEIDIERNTFASITSGNAPNGGNNTIFASTVIGNSTAPKTYYIRNEGTANLTISNLTSSNATEFPINVNPAPITLLPNEFVAFEVTFSPTGSGIRNSTISITNNDSDENPYIINVQGNGDCAASSLSITPESGPENTIITVIGSNFGGSTTASINGVAATVALISATEIEVIIPSGATTGSLEVTDELGCVGSELFTVISNSISSCEGSSGLTPSDLFISEVTDHGSGSHSYVEIFNGTGAAVNLAGYEIRIHNNGAATATNTIALSGTIANNDVWVVAFGSVEYMDPHAAHGYDQASSVSGINDDDHIRLYNGATWVDLWGDTSGNVFTVASKDYTYRRKNSGIVAPSTTWNVNDWDAFTPVDYSDIGSYDFSVGTPPTITVEPNLPISNCDLTATISVTATEGYSGGNPLTYQWYYSAPGDIGWTIITNGATYSGATSDTLNILDALNLNNYQYYCEVREDSNTCYTASNAVRLNIAQAIWDGTSWSSLPTSSKVVIIDGDYNTGVGVNDETSFSACQLIVNAGNELVITAGEYVEVINNVDVYGDGTGTDGILIEDKGSFVQRGNGVAAGTYIQHANARTQVNKRTAPLNNWYEYTYWSSPVVGETIGNGLAEAHPTRRYWFNGQNYLDATAETNNNNGAIAGQDDIDDNGNDWQFANNGDIMQPGVGYAAMHNSAGFGMPGANYEYIFEGALNTGDFMVPIYRNDAETNDNNWNFIGNPYPSAIDADAFLAANAVIDQSVSESTGIVDGAIFFWSQNSGYSDTNNGNEVLNFAQSDYAVINGTGQTAGGDGIMPDRFIPSGQGFFISLSDAATTSVVSGTIRTANVVFQNSIRTTGNNNQFFRTQNDSNPEKLWLNLTTNNGVFNQILIGYVPGATNNYDGMFYDAPKNLSTDSFSSLYSIIGDDVITLKDKLVIQGKSPESLNLDEVIPLGFMTNINEVAIYNISIEQLQGAFLTNNIVYLKDNLLNITHNLLEQPYSFTSETGEFNDRFEIVFRDSRLSIDENIQAVNGLTIFEQDNGDTTFTVNATHQIKQVTLIDMLGRIVFTAGGSSNKQTYSLSHLSQANYIAKVQLDNGHIITKKMIKK